MKYNQPYGITDANAPYINGDPSIGRQGSIPPAESIEFDQREIVAVIQWAFDHGYHDMNGVACAAPTNADLTQLLKAIWGIKSSDKLTLNLTYYVNDATGNDANNGLSAGTAFKTIQKAVDMSQQYDPNGNVITINVADGTYKPFTCGGGAAGLKGWGTVSFVGNVVSPANVFVQGSSSDTFWCAGFYGPSRQYLIGGFKFAHSGAGPVGGVTGVGIISNQGSYVTVYNCDFGACLTYHMWASQGTILQAGAIDHIPGVSFPFLRVSGNAGAHMRGSQGGQLGSHGPDMTISAPVNIGVWATADSLAVLLHANYDPAQTVWYNTLTGKANVTGQKYSVGTNAMIGTGSGGDVNYFPGTIAGSTGTGGQYG